MGLKTCHPVMLAVKAQVKETGFKTCRRERGREAKRPAANDLGRLRIRLVETQCTRTTAG